MYPCLIPNWALNATVRVIIAGEGLTEDGEETADFDAELKCNIQLRQTQKLTADKELITIGGKATFQGDICPDIAVIKGGTLTMGEATYDIRSGSKSLNFDGTVNYTELELM